MTSRLALSVFLGFLLCFSVFSFSYSFYEESFSPEKIKSFDVEINLNKDASFWVREKIIYDFGPNHRHGIFRVIPTKGIRISKVQVFDEQNKPYKFQTKENRQLLEIKIGDPNKLITGVHVYNIEYKVEKGILFFEDHDELYWNVTGNQWKVPIEKVSAVVNLPEELPAENLQADCFTGFYGSKERDCRFFVSGKKEVRFVSLKDFSSGEGFTIVLGFPKGLVTIPVFKKVLWGLERIIPFFIPLLTFFFLFYQWFTKGRDPKIKKPIVVQYEPPDNLRPMEVQAILKQKINNRAFSATLIDLAVRGFVKIKELEKKHFFSKKDYEFIKLREFENSEELFDYEKKFLKKLFGKKEKVRLSELKKSGRLARSVNSITKKCFQELTDRKYFSQNPRKVLNRWHGYGVIIFFIVSFLLFIESPDMGVFFLFSFTLSSLVISIIFRRIFHLRNPISVLELKIIKKRFLKISTIAGTFIVIFGLSFIFLFVVSSLIRVDYSLKLRLVISLWVSGALFLIFARFMPKKTKKGADAYWKILGFRDFIKTAEKYRAQFYERENIFEEYLPYAILFGLTDKWAKAFEGIYQNPPSWYEGPVATSFSVAAFTDSLNHSLSAFGSSTFRGGGAVSGSSGLGGGGFSGGGFGGGGGGSW
ncbi:DUF2207 domain-containing protein [bacterium]|nr:DUF2207 domain-containing protein [bacterium]